MDDEREIVDLLEEVLQRDGFLNIRKAYTGTEALEACLDFQPDVVILDIMLPDIDGLEVCKKNKGFFLLLYTVLILQK